MQSPKRYTQDRKRSRGTPTSQTPVRPHKRVPLRELAQNSPVHLVPSPRRLVADPIEVPTPRVWSEDEVKALVEYIHANCNGSTWPSHHSVDMWNAAGLYIRRKVSTAHQRSGIIIAVSMSLLLLTACISFRICMSLQGCWLA